MCVRVRAEAVGLLVYFCMTIDDDVSSLLSQEAPATTAAVVLAFASGGYWRCAAGTGTGSRGLGWGCR